jgi:hypothetical protein
MTDILQARREEIEADLQNPFIDKPTAFALLDELAELETEIQKDGTPLFGSPEWFAAIPEIPFGPEALRNETEIEKCKS